MKKGGRISARSPTAIRKRITAVVTECRKRILDDPPACSISMDDTFQALTGASVEPSSPDGSKMLEFSTPKSGKRSYNSFLREGKEMQQSPEAALSSPSSVLNPPSSIKRRTIRDYFVSSS